MKKFTLIMMIAGSLLVTGCKKDEDKVTVPVKVQSVVVRDGLSKIKADMEENFKGEKKEGNKWVIPTSYGTKVYYSYQIIDNKFIKYQEFTIDKLDRIRSTFTIAEDAKVTMVIDFWNDDTKKFEKPLMKTFANADEYIKGSNTK